MSDETIEALTKCNQSWGATACEKAFANGVKTMQDRVDIAMRQLQSAEAEVERLKIRGDDYLCAFQGEQEFRKAAEEEVANLRAANAELAGALEPFANYAGPHAALAKHKETTQSG